MLMSKIGAVLGSVLGVILLFFLCLFLIRRRRRKQYENSRVSILDGPAHSQTHHNGPSIFSSHNHSTPHTNLARERPMSTTPFLPAAYQSTPFRGGSERSSDEGYAGSHSRGHSTSSHGGLEMTTEDGPAMHLNGGAAGMKHNPGMFRGEEVYQHQDGWRLAGGRVEVPPAYTGIRG
jgi:hypothetical protein